MVELLGRFVPPFRRLLVFLGTYHLKNWMIHPSRIQSTCGLRWDTFQFDEPFDSAFYNLLDALGLRLDRFLLVLPILGELVGVFA